METFDAPDPSAPVARPTTTIPISMRIIAALSVVVGLLMWLSLFTLYFRDVRYSYKLLTGSISPIYPGDLLIMVILAAIATVGTLYMVVGIGLFLRTRWAWQTALATFIIGIFGGLFFGLTSLSLPSILLPALFGTAFAVAALVFLLQDDTRHAYNT